MANLYNELEDVKKKMKEESEMKNQYTSHNQDIVKKLQNTTSELNNIQKLHSNLEQILKNKTEEITSLNHQLDEKNQ